MATNLRNSILVKVSCVAFEVARILNSHSRSIPLAQAAPVHHADPFDMRLHRRCFDIIFQGDDVAARDDPTRGSDLRCGCGQHRACHGGEGEYTAEHHDGVVQRYAVSCSSQIKQYELLEDIEGTGPVLYPTEPFHQEYEPGAQSNDGGRGRAGDQGKILSEGPRRFRSEHKADAQTRYQLPTQNYKKK